MSTPPRRAALYLDFDNVFAGLALRDEAAAWHFAADPGHWLAWLAAGGDGGGERRVLIRRCYLNPAGWTEPIPGGALAQWLGQPRIFYSRFRADFVRAGFEVIDCPRLARLKNGADILMALDVAEALAHPTRFDEFILLSGDSDFTPLLHRLRAHDRRALLVAQDASAQALLAAAEAVIPLEDFAAAAIAPEREAAPSAPHAAEAPPVPTRDALQDATRRILTARGGRIRLRALGQALGQALGARFGHAAGDSAHGGADSLRTLVAAMPGIQLRMVDGTDWAMLAEGPEQPGADPFATACAIVVEAGGSLATAALGNLFQQRLGFGLRNSAYAGTGSLDAFIARAGLRFGAEGTDRNMVVLAPMAESGAPGIQAAAEDAGQRSAGWDAAEVTGAEEEDPALAEGTDAMEPQDRRFADLLLRALGPGLDLSGLASGTLAAILRQLGRRLPLPRPPDPTLAEIVAEEAEAAADAPAPPHAVARLIRLLQLGRFDWSADPGHDPAAGLAAALEAEIRRQATISRIRLAPEEQAALTGWIHGPAAAPIPAEAPSDQAILPAAP
jgi:hypothetical protein